jgi:6-phosphogluconate dehydrogenase
MEYSIGVGGLGIMGANLALKMVHNACFTPSGRNHSAISIEAVMKRL